MKETLINLCYLYEGSNRSAFKDELIIYTDNVAEQYRSDWCAVLGKEMNLLIVVQGEVEIELETKRCDDGEQDDEFG